MIRQVDIAALAVFVFGALLLTCSRETKAEHPPAQEGPSARPASPAPATPTPAKVGKETPAVSPHPWPVGRGDARRTARSSIKGPRTSRLKWVFRTSGRIYGDVAISREGTIYVPSHDGNLYAVGSDGRQLWAFDAGGKIWSSPAIAPDGTVYFGSDADRFFALSPTGEVRWIFSTEAPLKKGEQHPDGRWDVDTSPVIASDGTVYFGCHYFLYALRPTGEVRWRFQVGVDRVKIFSSPALDDKGNIYFGTQGQRFFALSPSSEVLWNAKTGADADSTPCTAGDMVYFAADDGKVRAAKGQNGEIVWEADLGAPVRAPLALAADGGVIAATFGHRPSIAMLDGSTGAERWRFGIRPGDGAFYGIQSGALVDGEGYVYFGGRDNHIYCLTPQGALAWKYETGDQVDASPVLGPDGTLYIGSDDKRLYAFSR